MPRSEGERPMDRRHRSIQEMELEAVRDHCDSASMYSLHCRIFDELISLRREVEQLKKKGKKSAKSSR